MLELLFGKKTLGIMERLAAKLKQTMANQTTKQSLVLQIINWLLVIQKTWLHLNSFYDESIDNKTRSEPIISESRSTFVTISKHFTTWSRFNFPVLTPA